MHLLTPTQFKSLDRAKQLPPGAALRKQAVEPVEPALDAPRVLRFTISTEAIDRDRDRIELAGWETGAFLKNPVVLWGHDSCRLPVGKVVGLGVEGGALKATVAFVPSDMPEAGAMADAVYRLASEGYLSATSVGFRPLEWEPTTDKARGADDWFPGIDFHRQELVELSIVNIPSNPETLIEPALPQISAQRSHADNQQATRARARRRRVLQLVQAIG